MKNKYLIYFVTLLTILSSSCKKESSIGADILPGDDLLNVKYTDTFTINGKTIADTFLRTDKLAINYLGVINDSKFGIQKASIAIEFDKPTGVYDDSLNTTYTIDSVVLFMNYSSVYGDTTVPQNFEVTTLPNKINETQIYYSNATGFAGGSVLGTANDYLFTPTTNWVHMTRTDSVGLPGIMRIKLNSSFGNNIIDLGRNVLRDSSLFKNAFPGILVANSDNAGKAMAEINTGSNFTSIVIFYKDKYNAPKEMRLYSSIVKYVNGVAGTRVNGVNLFSNTLNSTVNNVISSGENSDSINYVLGQGGALMKLSMPTLTNLGKVAVNKAMISVSQIIQNSNIAFTQPSYFIILKRNTAGNLDIISTGDGAGIADTSGRDVYGNKIAVYNFNISKYVQAISSGSENNTDLYLATYRFAGTDPAINILNSSVNNTLLNIGYVPSRVIVAGPNYSDPKYKLKLNLTYTLIK